MDNYVSYFEQSHDRTVRSLYILDTPGLDEANKFLGEYGTLWTDLKRGRLYSLIHRICYLF